MTDDGFCRPRDGRLLRAPSAAGRQPTRGWWGTLEEHGAAVWLRASRSAKTPARAALALRGRGMCRWLVGVDISRT